VDVNNVGTRKCRVEIQFRSVVPSVCRNVCCVNLVAFVVGLTAFVVVP
jgi:hypothetical protein